MEINSANDDVESKNIEFFSQNSKDFKLSDALEMKRLEKNYQINHNMPNLTGIKSRIDTGLRRNKENLNFNRTGMTNNIEKRNNYFDPKNVIFKFKNFTNLLIIF